MFPYCCTMLIDLNSPAKDEKILMLLEYIYSITNIFFILYSTMQNIYEFNHIDKTLSEEKVKKMKDFYAYYHKKHFGYEKL